MARVFILGGIPESLTNFRWHLLARLVAEGHQIYASAPNASVEIQEKLATQGIVYKNISLERSGLNPLKDLVSIIDLYWLLTEIKPDVFFGYTLKPVVYGSLAARLAGVPKIITMIEGLGYAFTGTGARRKLLNFIATNLYRRTLKFSYKIFFLNSDDLAFFQEKHLLGNIDQAVLINGIGVDLEKFTPANYPSSLSFLMICRLVKDKGVREYIEAASTVRKNFPEVKFKLAGFIDNNPSAITEQELNSWISSGTIEYLGYLRDVHKAIAESSVYVLPSYREGLPVTVMEAMAMARPIITTNAPGCRETVVQGENGFLVPVKDVQSLVVAMEHFIGKPNDIKRMGIASRRIAEDEFDVHKVNTEILHSMNLKK